MRQHGSAMTNSEIVQKFLPKRRLSTMSEQPEGEQLRQRLEEAYACIRHACNVFYLNVEDISIHDDDEWRAKHAATIAAAQEGKC